MNEFSHMDIVKDEETGELFLYVQIFDHLVSLSSPSSHTPAVSKFYTVIGNISDLKEKISIAEAREEVRSMKIPVPKAYWPGITKWVYGNEEDWVRYDK